MRSESPEALDPFSAPEATGAPPSRPVQRHYGDATLGQRFANMVIDLLGAMFFIALLGFFSAIAGYPDLLAVVPEQLFLLLSITSYYVLLEGLTGRTLGKLVTGTRVVGEDDRPASFLRIVGRSVSRFVPFEGLSFLGGDARGWHDRWTHTRVVRLRPHRWQQM